MEPGKQHMRVIVAGQDRTETLGAQIRESARRRAAAGAPRFLSPEHSALRLKAAHDQAEYLKVYNRLVGMRHGIHTEIFAIPHHPGRVGSMGARIKKLLWKLLRYQHDRMAGQQNLVNELVIAGLKFEREETCRAIARLEARVARLETRGGS